MHGSDLVVPHIIADRHREARLNSLARLVRSRRSDSERIEQDPTDRWSSESYVPTLRGYPLDPFYANRSR